MTMVDCWNEAGVTDAGLDPIDDADTIKKYKAMRLIEAMETNVMRGSVSLGSVFDLFALPAKQEQVAGWFNSAGSDGVSIMMTGDLLLNGRNQFSSTVNCKDSMNPASSNSRYWFVAMGKSPLGSGYAFSAARYLFYPDDTPPQVIGLSTMSTTDLTDNPVEAGKKSYWGTVTITFNNDLYYHVPNTDKYLQVVDKPLVGVMEDGYTSSAVLLESDKNISIKHKYTGADGNPTCNTLIIQFSGIREGSQFSLSQHIATSRGITAKVPLTLEMKLVKNDMGLYKPQFVIKSSGWGDL